jgi:hypothetical protein
VPPCPECRTTFTRKEDALKHHKRYHAKTSEESPATGQNAAASSYSLLQKGDEDAEGPSNRASRHEPGIRRRENEYFGSNIAASNGNELSRISVTEQATVHNNTDKAPLYQKEDRSGTSLQLDHQTFDEALPSVNTGQRITRHFSQRLKGDVLNYLEDSDAELELHSPRDGHLVRKLSSTPTQSSTKSYGKTKLQGQDRTVKPPTPSPTWICNNCGKAFSRKDRLDNHKRKQYLNSKSIKQALLSFPPRALLEVFQL